MIELRRGDLTLKVANQEHAELYIAWHMQRSFYGLEFERLSHDSEMYNKELVNVRDTQLKQQLKELGN